MTHDVEDRPPGRPPVPLALPFPTPGPLLRQTYRELDQAEHGTDAERVTIERLGPLPRPWDPATITTPALRGELWDWLEQIVCWVNTEYVWDATSMIPSCWPLHPHLVHEIAALADQRHKAGQAYTSDPLEVWHRWTFPGFIDRMQARTRTACDETHQPWPAKGRYARHTTERDRRDEAYHLDQHTCRTSLDP